MDSFAAVDGGVVIVKVLLFVGYAKSKVCGFNKASNECLDYGRSSRIRDEAFGNEIPNG